MTWTRERWSEIQAIFLDAVRETESDRPTFLASACGGDVELRAAVERLLGADAGRDDPMDELLEHGAIGVLRGKDPLLRELFGPFRLIERIADGGMGSVYRAERQVGDFTQPAAIKVLRLGLSTERMRERFARERQTLARLLHPNVARLLDGGTTAQGVPFFAMELIDGLPIDRFCDERKATVRQRLELFATVCRAVHFAHQNLVVHQDLKPGNILVDPHGVPKLVDFGVAGLLIEAAGGATEATRTQPMTPEYASPEQLRGGPVSTATDVYALGVVFFELLTGRRPFEATAADGVGFARIVCEIDASRPSTAFATTGSVAVRAAGIERASHRGTSVGAIVRLLRGDLDRIALKALRKEPAQRYSSCQEFADDIDRHLRGFPVTAREPSLGYRIAKFVRRNRVGVGAAVLVAAALVAGIVSTLRMADIARTERDVAEAAQRRVEHEMNHARIEAASSRVVASFLSETFLSADFVGGDGGRDKLRAVIHRRAEQVRRQYADVPHLRANLLDALGRTAGESAAFDEAEQLIAEAMAIRREQFGVASLECALSLTSLGRLRYQQGRFEEAATALRECYQLHLTCPRDVHTDVAAAANDLAAAERALGNRERSRELHLEALGLRRGAGGDPVLVAESLNNLANSESDLQRAQELLLEALAVRVRILGDDDPLTLQSRVNLGRVAMARRDFATAAPLLREAVDHGRRLGGLGADGLALALGTLAYAELQLDDPDKALAAIEEAIELDRQRFTNTHARVAKDQEVLASVLARRGDAAGAVAAAREVVRIARATAPAGHPQIAGALCVLGRFLTAAADPAGALTELDEALRIYAAAAARPVDIADTQRNRADACESLGRLDLAEQALVAALAVYEVEPSRQWAIAAVRSRLHDVYLRLGRPEDAARFAEAPAKKPR